MAARSREPRYRNIAEPVGGADADPLRGGLAAREVVVRLAVVATAIELLELHVSFTLAEDDEVRSHKRGKKQTNIIQEEQERLRESHEGGTSPLPANARFNV